MHNRLLRRRQVEEITGIESLVDLPAHEEWRVPTARQGRPQRRPGGGKATSRPGWSRGRKRGARLARPIRRRCDLYDRSHGYILLFRLPHRGQPVR